MLSPKVLHILRNLTPEAKEELKEILKEVELYHENQNKKLWNSLIIQLEENK